MGSCKPKSYDVQDIHIEDFFTVSLDKQWNISPDGEYLSWVEVENNLNYLCLETTDSTRHQKYKLGISQKIKEYHWINNQQIIYLSDSDSSHLHQLFCLDLPSKQSHLCYSSEQAWKLILPSSLPVNKIALLLPSSIDSRLWDAYHLDLHTKQLILDAKNKGQVIEWIYDHKLQLRAAKAISKDKNQMELWYRKYTKDEFYALFSYPFSDEIKEICFTNDEDNLNLLSNIERDKLTWIEFNPQTKKEVAQWHIDANVDLDHFIRFPYTAEVLGVSYTNCTNNKYIKNDKLDKVTQSINLFLGNTQWEYVKVDEKREKFILFCSSDIEMGSYYLYNKPLNKFTSLSIGAKWLPKSILNPQICLSIPFNKNENLLAYISFPEGYTKLNASELPLIIYIHEGPFIRDRNKYQAEVQFFTHKGYAVLQVNYRGSAGFGKAFKTAAYQQWGTLPAQDIKTALTYVIDQSWVDRRKIVLLGNGFGAFVAQKCIEKSPNLFACAILNADTINLKKTVEKAYTVSDSLGSYLSQQFGFIYTDTNAAKRKADSIFWAAYTFQTSSSPTTISILHSPIPQAPYSKKEILNAYLRIDDFLNTQIKSTSKTILH
ncbi:MAG: prolyl oligopeptidase family serine peptidase [Bacteroidales bacterium]